MKYRDSVIVEENNMIDSISIILDNTGYTPEYLKKCYVVEFYQILKYVREKLERAASKSK